MRIFIAVLSISFLIIGVLIMSLNGCAPSFIYKSHECKDPDIGISSLDYLEDWKIAESRGSYGSYAQIQFIEWGRRDATAVASMSFTAQKIGGPGVPATLDSAVEDLIKKRMLLKDAKILSKTRLKLLGENAASIDISYTGLDMPYTKQEKSVKMREQVILLYKGAKSYLFSFEDAESGFGRYDKAFIHIVKSIKFKD